MPEDEVACEVCCVKRPKPEMIECVNPKGGYMCRDEDACFQAWLVGLFGEGSLAGGE